MQACVKATRLSGASSPSILPIRAGIRSLRAGALLADWQGRSPAHSPGRVEVSAAEPRALRRGHSISRSTAERWTWARQTPPPRDARNAYLGTVGS